MQTGKVLDFTRRRVRDLNDQFRSTFDLSLGQVVMTRSVISLSPDERMALVKAVRAFNAFTEDNDPHGEHDFGDFVQSGQKYFWKIDYYDRHGDGGSRDAGNARVTMRVLTILRADEY